MCFLYDGHDFIYDVIKNIYPRIDISLPFDRLTGMYFLFGQQRDNDNI